MEADAPIDYASFQIFPDQNRYEAFVCNAERVEKLAEGPLQHLLPHLPEAKVLYARGSHTIYKLQLPENLTGASWFTKLNVERFLCVIQSSELICKINATKEEISQLEEARKFHLSLYTKSHLDNLESGETDDCRLVDKPKIETASSDASKNELLRAMELRLTALRTELAVAFNEATGCTLSKKEVSDLAELFHYVGAEDLKDAICNVLEVREECGAFDSLNDKSSVTRNHINKNEGNAQLLKPSHSAAPVRYGASPAKAAEMERQYSTESDEMSDSSEDQGPAERSRTLVRSAAPRRSASPMRRIQIGRTGTHRPTALTIRSLNYIPARDKTFSHRDESANSSEAEESEPRKNSVIHVRRMSVQDAINLFESKQRDQSGDVHKMSQPQASVGTNKSVLRRWSAGTGEPSQSQPDTVSEATVPLTPNVTVTSELEKGTAEEKLNSDFASPVHDQGDNAEVEADLQHTSGEAENKNDSESTQTEEENSDRPTASAEWSRQKEAELNQMLMKMMETKPGKYQKPHDRRNQSVSAEQRGGFYDHYKVKRDEKLRENAGQRADKEAKLKVIHKILDDKRTEMVSVSVNDVDKKRSALKSQKSLKSPSVTATSRKESSKPSSTKKILSKSSSLPATRKSWLSVPSPRTSVLSPGKTSGGTSSVASTTRRKSQPMTSVAQASSKKVEKSPQPQRKTKALQINEDKNLKSVIEKRQQTVSKGSKLTNAKSKPGTAYSDTTRAVQSQTKSKVTKKSSVVPVEPKPFLRKGSRVSPGVVPATIKKKSSSPSEKTQNHSGSLTETQVREVVNISECISQQQEINLVSPNRCDASTEPEILANNNQKCVETENHDQVFIDNVNSIKNMEDSSSRFQAEEECVISPSAWVEIEEQQDIPSLCDNGTSQVVSSVNDAHAPLEMSSSRVRHSLSQMLQEESVEPDTNEWGYAENPPPAIVYQRDAPKGLKRLLNFARKSKGDSNASGWSTPSVFSEGEDDNEELRTISRRNSDSLIRKAALNAKNLGTHKVSMHGGHERNSNPYDLASGQPNTSSLDTQNSLKRQDRLSAGASSTKASRSFFSLSAFRGSKPNETKLR